MFFSVVHIHNQIYVELYYKTLIFDKIIKAYNLLITVQSLVMKKQIIKLQQLMG